MGGGHKFIVNDHIWGIYVMFGQLSLISSSRHQNVTKIFTAGRFFFFFFFFLVAGRITCKTDQKHWQSYNCHQNPTGLTMWGDFPGAESQFSFVLFCFFDFEMRKFGTHPLSKKISTFYPWTCPFCFQVFKCIHDSIYERKVLHYRLTDKENDIW